MDNFLPVFIVLPLFAAFLILLSRMLSQYMGNIIALVSSFAILLMSVYTLIEVIYHTTITCNLNQLPPPFGIAFMLDGLSVFLLVTVSFLHFLATVYSIEYFKASGKSMFYVFFLLLAAGINGILLSTDFFNVFLFTELTVISAYILTSYYREPENFEASFKYTTMGTFSSLLILLAFILIYSATSTLSFSGVAAALGTAGRPLVAFISVLLISGIALKSTLVPFHAWVPDAYTSAPSPAAALFSGAVSKVAGIYLMIRLFFNVIGVTPLILNLLSILGVISIVIGVTLALYQWDFKRLLAYHSISQIGYIMLGLGLGTPLAVVGALFHLINHSVFKSLLFLNAGSVEYAAHSRDLKKLGGLAQKMPVTASTSMIASLSISGVPPLNGFWSKLFIILACVSAGKYIFAFLAVAGSILTLSSFLKVQRYAFYGYLKDTFSSLKEVPLFMSVPMLILALLCLFMGILLLPGIDRVFIGPAVETVLRGKSVFAVAARGMIP